ncbi:MAG: polysaccharide biosynthesis protein, partial [Robiginitalea sp.]
ISKTRDLDYAWVRSKIEHLCVSNMFFNADTVKLMKEIVPEFVSNNSDYCRLDKEKRLPIPAADVKEEIPTSKEGKLIP